MGIEFDWEKIGPNPSVISLFENITDDKAEFPQTYSGQAWRAAYRLWLAIRYKSVNEQRESTKDGFCYDASWNWSGEQGGDDLGLSGFMAGWAINAVRQMLYLNAIPNPALLTMNGPQKPLPDTASAAEMLKAILS